MRAFKTSVISILALGLLAGSVVGVAAQDESEASDPDGSAPVSFTMPYLGQTEQKTVDFDEARRLERGSAYEGPIDSGDPRLSGTLRMVSSRDIYMDSQGHVVVSVVGIDDEDGAWRGTSLGYTRPFWDATYHQLLLTGEGAYEGLSAILFLMDNGTDFDVEGMIFPGELPPFPEPPAE